MIQFLSSLLFVIDVIAAVLLIAIIMIQQSKSGGGIGAISGGGGGMGESVLGPSAGNIITRTTVILASVFLACTLFLAVLSKYKTEDVSIAEKLQQQEQAKEVEKPVPEDGEDVAEESEDAGSDGEKEQFTDLKDERAEETGGNGQNTDASTAEKGDAASAETE